jgi:hypothetical protein
VLLRLALSVGPDSFWKPTSFFWKPTQRLHECLCTAQRDDRRRATGAEQLYCCKLEWLDTA